MVYFTIGAGEHQRLVLASDGLWDVCSTEQAAKVVRKAQSCEAAGKALTKLGRERHLRKFNTLKDDVTVLIVELNPSALEHTPLPKASSRRSSSSKRSSSRAGHKASSSARSDLSTATAGDGSTRSNDASTHSGSTFQNESTQHSGSAFLNLSLSQNDLPPVAGSMSGETPPETTGGCCALM